MNKYKKDKKLGKKIAKAGKKKYFKYFNSDIVSDYIISKTNQVGRHSGYFLIGYGVARSVSEIYRTPDAVWGNDFLLFSFLTQGQLLSVPMIILGIFILTKK